MADIRPHRPERYLMKIIAYADRGERQQVSQAEYNEIHAYKLYWARQTRQGLDSIAHVLNNLEVNNRWLTSAIVNISKVSSQEVVLVERSHQSLSCHRGGISCWWHCAFDAFGLMVKENYSEGRAMANHPNRSRTARRLAQAISFLRWQAEWLNMVQGIACARSWYR